MTKKIFVILTVLFVTLFLGSSVFATNALEDGVKDMGTEVKDSWDKMSGTVQNAGNNIKGAMNTMGNTVKGTTESMGNSMKDAAQSMGDTMRDVMDGNDGYEATRTSSMNNTNSGLFGMNSTAWTWLILAVLAVAIGGLVWYYGAQNTNNSRNK